MNEHKNNGGGNIMSLRKGNKSVCRQIAGLAELPGNDGQEKYEQAASNLQALHCTGLLHYPGRCNGETNQNTKTARMAEYAADRLTATGVGWNRNDTFDSPVGNATAL